MLPSRKAVRATNQTGTFNLTGSLAPRWASSSSLSSPSPFSFKKALLLLLPPPPTSPRSRHPPQPDCFSFVCPITHSFQRPFTLTSNSTSDASIPTLKNSPTFRAASRSGRFYDFPLPNHTVCPFVRDHFPRSLARASCLPRTTICLSLGPEGPMASLKVWLRHSHLSPCRTMDESLGRHCLFFDSLV